MAKPSLMLVHGLLAPLDCFREMEPLITAADAHTIELIGYGANQGMSLRDLTLADQARHVAKSIESCGFHRVWVMGHSVGGAVTMTLAGLRPDLIAGIINVEGNFTLNDAFWSSRIARMPADDWAAEYRQMQSNPQAWLEKNDITVTPRSLAWGTSMLQHDQSAETIQAVAKAVIAATSPPEYLQMIRRVFASGIPIHLVAGERSAKGWDVPGDLRKAAASWTVLPGVGHIMQMEDPEGFCDAVNRLVG